MPVLPVSELLNRREPILLTCAFDDVGEGCRLTGELFVSPNGSGFRLRGRLTGAAQLTCDRCLRPFERPLTLELNETFLVRAARPANGKRADTDDAIAEVNLDESLDERDALDIDDLARQWAVMETAGQRLCADPACQY